jgi:hypothetical protein
VGLELFRIVPIYAKFCFARLAAVVDAFGNSSVPSQVLTGCWVQAIASLVLRWIQAFEI